MGESVPSQRLRKMKATLFSSFQGSSEKEPSIDEAIARRTNRLFTLKLGSPWDDYDYVRQHGQITLVKQKSSYFKLANIQESHTVNALQHSQILSRFMHQNVASIYGAYCYRDRILLVTEHLDISLAQLDFQSYELEEWEIATIVAEVLKGVTYILSMNVSCRDLTTPSVRLSVNGDIKIVLGFENIELRRQQENPRVVQTLLEIPLLAEMIEDMILSRYHHTSDDQRWSKEALSFLSCSISGSLQSLLNHSFLEKAISPRKLIPRIRSTIGMEILSISDRNE